MFDEQPQPFMKPLESGKRYRVTGYMRDTANPKWKRFDVVGKAISDDELEEIRS